MAPVVDLRRVFKVRGVTDGVAHEARGIISTQFPHTPAGWLMTSMAWEDERADLPVPDRYL